MRFLAALLLVVMLIAGCSQSGNVRMVKRFENEAGVKASDIPKLIQKRLGFKIESVKWVEKVKDGFTSVCLKVTARKEKRGPVYMSYGWSPEFEWSVEKSTGTVIPVSPLAKQWMEGNI